jgi:hypothetical protein
VTQYDEMTRLMKGEGGHNDINQFMDSRSRIRVEPKGFLYVELTELGLVRVQESLRWAMGE